MKKNKIIISLFSLLFSLLFLFFGCKNNTFCLEGPGHYVSFDKERYNANDVAKIKILKSKTTDITEPLALFKIVNKDGTVLETVNDFSKLELKGDYYIYKMIVSKPFSVRPEYYFNEIKKGVEFSDKIFKELDYYVVFDTGFNILSDVKFKKHKAIPYTTNSYVKIVFRLNAEDILKLGRVFINEIDVFAESDKPDSNFRVSSSGSTGFLHNDKIELTIKINKCGVDVLYKVSSK